MKKRFLAALISIVLLVTALSLVIPASAASSAATGAATYTLWDQNLMVYNSANSDDTGLIKDYARPKAMISRLKAADPDIITFQEANEPWISFLSSSWYSESRYFNQNYTMLYQYRKSSNKEAVPVAYKTAKFNQLASGHFWFGNDTENESDFGNDESGNPISDIYRICSWVVLEDKTTQDQIALFSIHLDLNVKARQLSVPILLSKIAAVKKDYPNAMVITAGDFNDTMGGSSKVLYDIIDGAGLADARKEAMVSTTDHATFHSGSTIDFALAEKATVAVKSFDVLTDDFGYSVEGVSYGLSDHYGLLMKFGSVAKQKGNMDGDENYTTADVALLLRHLSGWIKKNPYLADVNGDGKATTWDAILLARKLSA